MKSKGTGTSYIQVTKYVQEFYLLIDSSSCHFDTLIERDFGIPKITVGNLCKLFHDIISPYLPTSK